MPKKPEDADLNQSTGPTDADLVLGTDVSGATATPASGLPMDEFHGQPGEFVIGGDGKRRRVSEATAYANTTQAKEGTQ